MCLKTLVTSLQLVLAILTYDFTDTFGRSTLQYTVYLEAQGILLHQYHLGLHQDHLTQGGLVCQESPETL